MTRGDREAFSCWFIGEVCPSGQSVSAILEAVFLWCRDRNIYGPSAKELERLVRSQRQQYLDGWMKAQGGNIEHNINDLLRFYMDTSIIREDEFRENREPPRPDLPEP